MCTWSILLKTPYNKSVKYLNDFKTFATIQSMYSDQNGFKLEIENRQYFKSTYIWKFKTHFQLNYRQKKTSQRKLENSMNK